MITMVYDFFYMLVAAIALVIILIVWLVRRHTRKKSQESADLARLRQQAAAYAARTAPAPAPALTPSGSAVSAHGTILRFDNDPPPRLSVIPASLDGKQRVYVYPDVDLVKTTRTMAARAKVAQPVSFRTEGDAMQVMQGENHLGDMRPTRLVDMIREWDERGDPVFADLASYAPTGEKGVIRLAFYRDELNRMRKARGKIIARLNAVADPLYVTDDFVGSACTVEYDEDRKRYDVLVDDDRVGSLPPSAVEKIRAADREPEDMQIRIESQEYDADQERDAVWVIIT